MHAMPYSLSHKPHFSILDAIVGAMPSWSIANALQQCLLGQVSGKKKVEICSMTLTVSHHGRLCIYYKLHDAWSEGVASLPMFALFGETALRHCF